MAKKQGGSPKESALADEFSLGYDITGRSASKFSKKISTSSEMLGGASGTRTLDLPVMSRAL